MAEIVNKYVREKIDPQDRLKFIRTKTVIVPLDDETGEAAGRISAERRTSVSGWGLVDSCVLAVARSREAKVVTGDNHFSGLEEALII